METRVTRRTVEPEAMLDIIDPEEINIELQPRGNHAVLYVCINGQTKLRVRLEPGTKIRSNVDQGLTTPVKKTAKKAKGVAA